MKATYTKEAWDAQLKGNVVVSFAVNADGIPTDVEVIEGLGMGLDEQAVAAVRQSRYLPALRDGAPVAARGTTHIGFRMRDNQRYVTE